MQWADLANAYADVYGLDARVVLSIIYVESRGNPTVTSDAGAVGLGGIMSRDGPGPRLAFVNRPTRAQLFDPATNISWLCQILRQVVQDFPGNPKAGIAAYLLGPTWIRSAGMDSHWAQEYIRRFSEAWLLLWGAAALPWDVKVREPE